MDTGVRSTVKFITGSMRSEEHTSELQSRLHLVCRLLLEKKKKSHRQWSIRCITDSVVAVRVLLSGTVMGEVPVWLASRGVVCPGIETLCLCLCLTPLVA